SVFNDSKTFS
ncbi:hypothetical protein CP8484711_2041B, partial [Chlamydia psittaci 84-8471/1]